MQYTKLGNIREDVSRFGLGCMRLPQIEGEDGKKDFDDPAAIELIRAAIDNGVNYIDTAYAYGRSEEVVGKALLDGYRDKVTLVTKIPFEDETKTQQDLFQIFEEQLKRLQVDYIDVYLLHNMHDSTWKKAQEVEALDFLDKLKAQGKIKHAAFSFHEKVELLEDVLNAYDWDLVMVQYNYLDKYNQAGRKGVEMIAEKGIPVVAMEPLRGGLLAQDVPESITEAFGSFHPEANHAEKAFMWLYNQPEVKVVLSGSSTMEQLADSLKIFEKAESGILKEEDEQVYDRVREAWEEMVKTPCTACNYCMPCPAGVNIPEVFRMYNETARSSKPQNWLYDIWLVAKEEDAARCIECGMCEPQCPQAIEIIKELKAAHKAIKGEDAS